MKIFKFKNITTEIKKKKNLNGWIQQQNEENREKN